MPAEAAMSPSFRADDTVIIVLSTPPQPHDTSLSVQDFIIDGKRMIPFFTSKELLTASIEGNDFPYPVVGIKFGMFIDMLNGSEILICNPYTAQQVAFNVADLIGE